jgi:hypothetical protein
MIHLYTKYQLNPSNHRWENERKLIFRKFSKSKGTNSFNNDWLFIVLRPAQEYFTYMETSPLPVLGAQGLWAGRDLYRAKPAVTRDLGLSGLIRRTAPFSRLLRHTRGCGGSMLTRILTGSHSVASYDMQGDAEDLFLPGSHIRTWPASLHDTSV